MRKFFTYPVFMILFLSFIGTIGFGAIVKYHYDGGKKYQFLQKLVILIAEVPMNLNIMIKYGTLNLDSITTLTEPLKRHENKKKFQRFIANPRNSLLIIPRYDQSLATSLIDIIDLNDFNIIHTYKPNIAEIVDVHKKDISEIKNKEYSFSPQRIRYMNPIIYEDGSLTSFFHSTLFKIDLCSDVLMFCGVKSKIIFTTVKI